MVENFRNRYLCIYEAPGTSLKIGSYYFCCKMGRMWFVLGIKDATYNCVERIIAERRVFNIIAIYDDEFENHFYIQKPSSKARKDLFMLLNNNE